MTYIVLSDTYRRFQIVMQARAGSSGTCQISPQKRFLPVFSRLNFLEEFTMDLIEGMKYNASIDIKLL